MDTNALATQPALFQARMDVIPPPAKHTTAPHKRTEPHVPHTPEPQYRMQIVWRNVIIFVYFHITTAYMIYRVLTFQSSVVTAMMMSTMGSVCGLGITAGAHRLWAHRAYKAKWPMRVFLAILQAVAFQNNIYEWARDHRMHHKFTDTDADPHNSRRGFFFSHVGWLMVRKHPDVIEKGKTLDMSDLEKDWVVNWQRKYYLLLMPMCCFVIPPTILYNVIGENLWESWNFNIMRYTLSLNFTWLVNSAAHIWGMKPYDRDITSAENMSVAFLAIGEGFHNYHHTFPWDYKASELSYYTLNVTSFFLDVCTKLGLAYDLKTASSDLIRKRILRSGDGTHKISKEVWGWGDKDMPKEEISMVEITNPKKKN